MKTYSIYKLRHIDDIQSQNSIEQFKKHIGDFVANISLRDTCISQKQPNRIDKNWNLTIRTANLIYRYCVKFHNIDEDDDVLIVLDNQCSELSGNILYGASILYHKLPTMFSKKYYTDEVIKGFYESLEYSKMITYRSAHHPYEKELEILGNMFILAPKYNRDEVRKQIIKEFI